MKLTKALLATGFQQSKASFGLRFTASEKTLLFNFPICRKPCSSTHVLQLTLLQNPTNNKQTQRSSIFRLILSILFSTLI
ncbi:hypothetical protein ES319_D11G264000v1 [Gossypium barbadense]|uniref:Uncharacterized protein n=1 Tax=Gossypium barbadense TaxID=3634 RepID=A0A5J5PJG0_GOSBA|nr:hypothetical protein ES319_D11G264000v1 [Gossypium barbadense]